ncbi:MAG: lysine 2,3-aminomutase [Fidelibacterota bacterium]|nr:MAG: lysine 2,3-aminomutase [Candidatus Neomarinimicrobiota bacterium]
MKDEEQLSFQGIEPALRLRVYSERQIDDIPQIRSLSQDQRFAMRVVAQVLPFRVNQYVLKELIDWEQVPNDPIFQMTFPQPEMLPEEHFTSIAELLRAGSTAETIRAKVREIQAQLNPHPGGQQDLNIPTHEGRYLPGMQHKYRQTVLFFPQQGQTCHTYCSFCFRWPQFVGRRDLRFAATDVQDLGRYLSAHREVSDVLVTGGDPMVMRARLLAAYLEPLLGHGFEHVTSIRIGTKSLTYWPYRYLTDDDADDLLHLLKRLVRAGKHVALMAHVTRGQELETEEVQEAVRRVRNTGAVIRTQAPLLAQVNDDASVWSHMWQTQVRLGMLPYYMFVERHTGPSAYFEVPLARGCEIYREAVGQISGLGRTVRGPSMSAGPGKVEVQGVAEISGNKVFVLRFIQGRNPAWVQRPFFAEYDEQATWLDQLRPAFGEKEFFFEPEYRRMLM